MARDRSVVWVWWYAFLRISCDFRVILLSENSSCIVRGLYELVCVPTNNIGTFAVGSSYVLTIMLHMFPVMLHVFNYRKHVQHYKCQMKQQCTNSVPIVKNSQTAKMTIGVPIVTCLHRVRRIHKATALNLLTEWWTWRLENKRTDFDANWHQWSTGKGHETLSFGSQKVKGQYPTRAQYPKIDLESWPWRRHRSRPLGLNTSIQLFLSIREPNGAIVINVTSYLP